jgi:hypothetical protein
MRLSVICLIKGMLLGGALVSGSVLACDQGFDGCLGCNDDQLPVCLDALVQEMCKASGDMASCDVQRVYDDAERHVLISTGSHMSHINSMARSARKYHRH